MTEDKKNGILHKLNNWGGDNLGKTLGIIFTDVTDDTLTATMPVTPRVHQPFGILHGRVPRRSGAASPLQWRSMVEPLCTRVLEMSGLEVCLLVLNVSYQVPSR